jgi:hypothetical protein
MARVRPKYQVFVSSTFRDLEPERLAVTMEVLRMGHIPAGMEQFPASDERGRARIQRTIDTSDYYVVLVGERYGDTDESGQSWTEWEYHYAKEKGLPVLAFVRTGTPIELVDREPGRQQKLSDFKALLTKAHLYKSWSNIDDLRAKVHQAVTQEIQLNDDTETPRPGWHRGTTQSLDAHSQSGARLEVLEKRIAELEQKLASASQQRGVFVRLDPIGRAYEALFPGVWRKTWHSPPSGTFEGWEEAYVTSNVYNVTRTSIGMPIKWRLSHLVEDGDVTRFQQADPHGRPLFETRHIAISKNSPDHYVGVETHTDQAGVSHETHVVYRRIGETAGTKLTVESATGVTDEYGS